MLALLGSGIDEIAWAGLGFGIPRVGARRNAVGGGGDQPEAGIRQRLLDLLVFGVGRVEILQDFLGAFLVDVRAQDEGLGQPAVHRRHRDRALGLLEIRQRRGEHAQASQRDAQGDLGRVGESRVELGVVDDRGQQLDDVRPALRAVVDHDCDPPGFAPARAARSDARDQLVRFFKLSGKVFGSTRRSQRRRVGEVEVVRVGRPKAQVEPGVVNESQCVGRQFHPALQRARRGRGARSRFQHRGGQVAGSGPPGPRVALVVGDAGKRGETRSGGGQVGRTLTVVDHDAERTAAGGEPADDVTVNPAFPPGMHLAELRACRCHRLPQPHRLPYIVCPNLTRLKLALPKLIVEAPPTAADHGRLATQWSLLNMIFISKAGFSAFPGARNHRHRGSAAEPVAGQCGQPRRLDSRGPARRSGKAYGSRTPTRGQSRPDAAPGSAQSGSTWTSMSMNSWPCPRSFARRRRRARACSPAAAAAAGAAAVSGTGAFFLAPEPALVLMDEPDPRPGPTR